MVLLQMQGPVNDLMAQKTATGLFMAILLIALVMFTGWARKLIADTLKQKNERIIKLEGDVKDIQHFINSELMKMLSEMQKTVQKNTDTFDRMEDILLSLKR